MSLEKRPAYKIIETLPPLLLFLIIKLTRQCHLEDLLI